MQYIGVDIIEIPRIRRVCERWGKTFLSRVFTPGEIRLCGQRYSSLAARFAAKEATLKALGACDRGISWQDIEILAESNGKPTINLFGKAREAAQALMIDSLDVSLSHSEDYAVAFAVGTVVPPVR